MMAPAACGRWFAAVLVVLGLAWAIPAYWTGFSARVTQWLLEQAWQDALEGKPPRRVLAFSDQTLGRLSWQDGNADWIILAGESDQNLRYAPILVEGSTLPGQGGTTLVAAHKDTHFSVLEHIQSGSMLIWQTRTGERLGFQVRETRVVDARHWQPPASGSGQLILTTCYPFDSSRGGPLRWVVMATPLPRSPDDV